MNNRIITLVAALSLIFVPAVALAGPVDPGVLVYVGPDIDGDGSSDKIVENTTTGFTVGYLLDGVVAAPLSGAISSTNIGAGYVTVGFPDLNGDGKSDKVIENTTSGFSVGYLLDGLNAVLEVAAIPGTNVPAGYTTVAFPDLNGDGKADKVIEHTGGFTVAYLMDGLTVTDSAAIAGTNVGAGYTTVGFPDLDGDGKADKVVENTATGYTVAFLMDGLSLKLATPIAGTNVGAGYETMGFPDINGDGKADKVVERDSDGNSVAFILDGAALLDSGGIPGTPTGASYILRGFPDLNGDGKADKVVTRLSDGKTYGYVMNGVAFTDDGSLPATPDGFASSGWVELWAP